MRSDLPWWLTPTLWVLAAPCGQRGGRSSECSVVKSPPPSAGVHRRCPNLPTRRVCPVGARVVKGGASGDDKRRPCPARRPRGWGHPGRSVHSKAPPSLRDRRTILRSSPRLYTRLRTPVLRSSTKTPTCWINCSRISSSSRSRRARRAPEAAEFFLGRRHPYRRCWTARGCLTRGYQNMVISIGRLARHGVLGARGPLQRVIKSC